MNVDGKNKTKVLIIGMNKTIGGIEKMILSYLRHIDKTKIAFGFINIYDKICFQDEFEKLGCQIHAMPNDKKSPFAYFFMLLSLLRHEHYGVIHVNMVSAANIVSLLAAKMAGCKHIIAHSHNTDLPPSMIRKILHTINKPFLELLATEYFACSEAAGKFLFGGGKFTVIKNAIDADTFVFNKNTREAVRGRLGVSADTGVIGHIGRFEEQKNHDFLLRIFKAVLAKRENVMLLLIGEGSLEQKIKNTAAASGIFDKIIFYGVTSAVQDLYSAMDVFILPSLYEGLGIVGIEAQCSCLPVIASSVIPQEMQVTGLVTRLDLTDSLDVWAEAVLEGLSPRERKNMAEYIIRAGYDIKMESKILEEKYASLDSL
jgi:glycosyltransferase involved in cell wall biosynthesis